MSFRTTSVVGKAGHGSAGKATGKKPSPLQRTPGVSHNGLKRRPSLARPPSKLRLQQERTHDTRVGQMAESNQVVKHKRTPYSANGADTVSCFVNTL